MGWKCAYPVQPEILQLTAMSQNLTEQHSVFHICNMSMRNISMPTLSLSLSQFVQYRHRSLPYTTIAVSLR